MSARALKITCTIGFQGLFNLLFYKNKKTKKKKKNLVVRFDPIIFEPLDFIHTLTIAPSKVLFAF